MGRFLGHLAIAVLFCSVTACSSGRQAFQSSLNSVPATDKKVCETCPSADCLLKCQYMEFEKDEAHSACTG